ncbi:MAG: hypothetical protein R3C15_00705 [Thermoleophilia bacterium]
MAAAVDGREHEVGAARGAPEHQRQCAEVARVVRLERHDQAVLGQARQRLAEARAERGARALVDAERQHLEREGPVVGLEQRDGAVARAVVDHDQPAARREQPGARLEVGEQAGQVGLLVEGRDDEGGRRARPGAALDARRRGRLVGRREQARRRGGGHVLGCLMAAHG